MSYQHDELGPALGWQHQHTPGIRTWEGRLTEWPSVLGAWPTEAEQAQAVTDYLAYRQSVQAKDDDLQRVLDATAGKVLKAIVLVGIEKGLWSLAELRTKYRAL